MVWIVYLVLDAAREQQFAARDITWAPPVYQRRLAAMTNTATRARSMAGLWLLQQSLHELGWPAEHFQRLGRAAGGRPELADGPHFSITHSAGLVACALSQPLQIGLDAEQRRAGIAPRLQRTIAADGQDFFAAWCAREATVKASGHVGLARVRGVQLQGSRACLDERIWRLHWLDLVPGYAACLAAEQAVPAQQIYQQDGACWLTGPSV